MAQPASVQTAASQFPQFYFQRSVITSSSLTQPSYLTLLTSYPLAAPAQDALSVSRGPLPAQIVRTTARHHLLAAVSSEPSIKLYNYTPASAASSASAISTPASLEFYTTLKGHTRPIHDLKFHNVSNSYSTATVETYNGTVMLSTASQDNTVRFWDCRQQNSALTFRHPKNKPFFSCASAGNLLAAGSGPFVFLWDLRTQKLMAANEEFHTEDINQIIFHPLRPNTFYTGAEDGLICEIKPEDPDQDEWLQNVLNIENPLSRFGFFGPQAEYVWALSCVETLSLWNINEADEEKCGTRISDFNQIRDHLTRATNITIDYLVDAHYDQQTQRVFLATGTNQGEMILSHVNRQEIQPFCKAHVEGVNEATSAAAAAGASSSSSSSTMSALTGFSSIPMVNDSPFAMSALTATAPQPQAQPRSASNSRVGSRIGNGDSMEDSEPEGETEANFLKDGEVIVNGTNGGGDESMGDGENENGEGLEAEPPRPPLNANAEGHTATIRDMLWLNNILITAGEDSRICLWSTERNANAHAQAMAASATDFKVRQHTTKGPQGAEISPASPPQPEDSNKALRQFTPY